MKALTAAQMREADRLATERFGMPSIQRMENAGTAIAEFLATEFPDRLGQKVVILCGKGNNGGDGFVVARKLQEKGWNPIVFLFARPDEIKGHAAANLKRWQEMSGELHAVTSTSAWEAARPTLAAASLIVDALLGIGLRGAVEGLLAAVIGDLNSIPGEGEQRRLRKSRVVAVDIPSGLASDGRDYGGPIVLADYTVSLAAPKVGQLVSPRCHYVGKLLVRDIGIPPELLSGESESKLYWLEPGEFRTLPLGRRANAHKRTFGHALIVSGSVGKSGAAVLAATAALRAGSGLVTVATVRDVLPMVTSARPELMTVPLFSTEEGAISLRNIDSGHFAHLLEGKNVLAAGPGAATHAETQQFIRAMVADCPVPVVLDADGLNAFAGHAAELGRRKSSALALAPHPGEMWRLLGCMNPETQWDRLSVSREAAARFNAHVVLKGYHTIVATPDGRAYVSTTGNPGMATGGSGDVLTGILAGLTAQFGVKNWERVLSLGVYLHGLAGDLAAARVGEPPLIASDVLASLPAAWRQVSSDIERVV